MKNIFLLAIVVLSSFTIVKASETSVLTTNSTNTEILAEAPAYWSGWARDHVAAASYSLYITVYRSANMCDSFYAVASSYKIHNLNGADRTEDINEELIVKEKENGRYYVSYRGKNFYFSM